MRQGHFRMTNRLGHPGGQADRDLLGSRDLFKTRTSDFISHVAVREPRSAQDAESIRPDRARARRDVGVTHPQPEILPPTRRAAGRLDVPENISPCLKSLSPGWEGLPDQCFSTLPDPTLKITYSVEITAATSEANEYTSTDAGIQQCIWPKEDVEAGGKCKGRDEGKMALPKRTSRQGSQSKADVTRQTSPK